MSAKINIITDENGKKMVVIDDIKFKGKRQIEWADVEMYLKTYIGKSYEIEESAEKVFIGKDFPDEYSWSGDTKRLMGTLAKAKANATQGLSELIQIASKPCYSPNYEEKHSIDARLGWYRYDVRFALPVYSADGLPERYNIFRARMLVRCAADGKKYLYDIVNIKKETSKPL